MKIKNKLIYSLLVFSFLPQLMAGDREVGNGGDLCSVEFVTTANVILERLRKDYPEKMPKIDLDAFEAAINTVKVESTDKQLFLNGIPKDAINYPDEKRILISDSFCKKRKPIFLRAPFVSHEYFPMLDGVDDSKYAYSRHTAGLFGGKVITPFPETVEEAKKLYASGKTPEQAELFGAWESRWQLLLFSREKGDRWMKMNFVNRGLFSLDDLGGLVFKATDPRIVTSPAMIDKTHLTFENVALMNKTYQTITKCKKIDLMQMFCCVSLAKGEDLCFEYDLYLRL